MSNENGEAMQQLANKRMSRRELLEIAGKLGIGAAALGPFLAACGGASTATPATTETQTAGATASPTQTAGATETTSATATPTAAAAAGTELTERDKTFVVGYTQQMSTIDPAVHWETRGSTVMAALYESMVTSVFHEEDSTVEFVPQLAESWEISPDNKVFTFKLRKGVTFHDGEPYNAEAQKFAFDRAMAMNEGGAYMLNDYIEQIEVVDEYTLKITLKKPIANYMQYFAGFWYPAKAISPKAVQANATADDKWAGKWFTGNATGTGAYKLDEWVPNQQYALSKYDGYWQGWEGNHMDKVLVRIIPEMATQRMLIEKGDIDLIMQPLPAQDFKALDGKPGIVLKKTESTRLITIMIHNQRPPTDNVNVRRGLVAAFDYDVAINNIYGGLAFRNATTYAKGMEGYSSDVPLAKKDLEKAKKYFADAGYASGLSLELVYIEGDENYRRMCEMFQADLASIGVNLVIRPISGSAIWDMQAKSETAGQLSMGGWTPDNYDSYSLAYILWHSKFLTTGGGVNWSFYKNPKVDELLDAVQTEPDKATRVKMYEDIDRMIRDDAAWIVVCQQIDGNAWRDSIKGAVPSPTRAWSVLPYDVYRG